MKITPDGKVKVLDFGLAKAFETETSKANLSQSPTLSMAATNAGVILGTAAYMSPEQAKGRAVDKRTDIFAFGCVLYEMLTGKPGFEGEDVQDVLGAVLKSEPDWTRLPADVPPSVRNLLRLCLEKNPGNRRSDAADVRIDIEQALKEPAKTSPSMAPARSALVAWIAAAVMTLAFVSIAVVHFRTVLPEVPEQTSRLSILPPEKTTFIGGYAAPYLALSPDGTRLAFVPTPIGGRALLWIRHLDALEAQPLTGTDGATFPFWSPDSRMLAFFADGKLKAIDPNGGAPYIICDAPDARGGAWGRDGLIVFAPQLLGPLYRVAASGGGQPEVMTTLDASRQEVSHRLPSFLPDGRHFLFLVQSGKPENSTVHIGSVDSNEIQSLDLRASRTAYVAPGYLLFVRSQSLTAQPFDLSRLRLSGEPVSLGQQVALRTGVYGDWRSLADNGTLVSWSGAAGFTDLTWFSRKGESLGTLGGRGEHLSLDLSPDEKRVAVELVDPVPGTGDIWVIDLASGLRSRLTSDPAWDFSPWWSPDGTRILFGSIRATFSLYQTLTAGILTEESVLKSADALGPTGWSSDNRFIVFQNMSKYKVGMLPLTGERTPKLALNSRFVESSGSLSPDGRWLAYTSNESGNWDIYVQPFPALDRKWRISPDGGSSPRWRRDGKELFYVGADQKLMAVSVTAESSFTAGTPSALFQLRMIPLLPVAAADAICSNREGRSLSRQHRC